MDCSKLDSLSYADRLECQSARSSNSGGSSGVAAYEAGDATFHAGKYYSPTMLRFEMLNGAATLLFGCVVFVILYRLMIRRVGNLNADSILRVFGTTTIIIMSIFLMSVGYSEEQVSRAYGLLGAIVGYLLGRNDRQSGQDAASDGKGKKGPDGQPEEVRGDAADKGRG
jgi:hypothetical protein